MKTEFAIIGGTLWGNRGAEAMVTTTMGRIREKAPGATFRILSYYPKEDRRLSSGVAGVAVDNATPRALLLRYMPAALLCWVFRLIGIRLPDAMLPAAVRDLRACKALFDVSGISFHDGRLAIVIYNVFCIWPAMLVGVPVVHLSQAMGPFNNLGNRFSAKWFLAACRHTFARGKKTAEYVQTLGLPADRWSIAADVAFSFKPGDSITNESEADVGLMLTRLAVARQAGKSVIALSPSSVVLSKTAEAGIPYVELFAKAAAHLHRLGYHLLIIPNATRAGADKPRNNDFYVIRQLKEAVDRELGKAISDEQSWVVFDLNTDSIRKLIGECDLLITSRFHAMVAGLSLCVPTFVIGWSHKYGEVLELFSCEADAIDFAKMRDGLIPAIDGVLAGLGERKARITAALPHVKASSLGQFDLVGSLVAK